MVVITKIIMEIYKDIVVVEMVITQDVQSIFQVIMIKYAVNIANKHLMNVLILVLLLVKLK